MLKEGEKNRSLSLGCDMLVALEKLPNLYVLVTLSTMSQYVLFVKSERILCA